MAACLDASVIHAAISLQLSILQVVFVLRAHLWGRVLPSSLIIHPPIEAAMFDIPGSWAMKASFDVRSLGYGGIHQMVADSESIGEDALLAEAGSVPFRVGGFSGGSATVPSASSAAFVSPYGDSTATMLSAPVNKTLLLPSSIAILLVCRGPRRLLGRQVRQLSKHGVAPLCRARGAVQYAQLVPLGKSSSMQEYLATNLTCVPRQFEDTLAR
jgi:hypothetical protein